MPQYKEQELTLFRPKTGGKNQSAVDGFYKNKNKECFFIKKPKDQRELFAELFAGLILQEFMDRKLIDPLYFPSLIVADCIQFEDGSYGLIQPMVSFTELHKIIGTSTSDRQDRDVVTEVLSGPAYYKTLIEQQQYFGLSTSLMFSLLLGAHSVHSGNVVAQKNNKMAGRQYGRLDWGDAFRNFAHPKNNDNLLYAHENRGWFNYKKLTKDYFLNYKLIPGLFPAMAKKASDFQSKVTPELMKDIVASALKRIPPDLIEAVKGEFADYSFMNSFKTLDLKKELESQSFVQEMASLLAARLEKITHLDDVKSRKKVDIYKSTLVRSSLKFSMKEESFPELLSNWTNLLNTSEESPKDLSIDVGEINSSQLIVQFNEYVNQLADQAEQLNLWQHEAQSTENIFAPLNIQEGNRAKFGDEFVSQHKESTIFRHLFTLDPKTGEKVNFPSYQLATSEYVSQNPESPWAKLQKMLTVGHTVIHEIIKRDNAQKFAFEEDAEDPSLLHEQLQIFMTAKAEVDGLFELNILEHRDIPGSSFFYGIDEQSLGTMNGEQLVTICMEELNHRKPSSLLIHIIKTEELWQTVDASLNKLALDRERSSVETEVKSAKLRDWRQLIDAQREIAPEQNSKIRAVVNDLKLAREELIALKTALDKLNKQFATAQTKELELKKEEVPSVVARKHLQARIYDKKQEISQLTIQLKDYITRNAERDNFLKAASESRFAQHDYDKAINDDQTTQYARALKMIPVVTKILDLEEKAKEFVARNKTPALESVNTLVLEMKALVQQYVDSDDDEVAALAAFKSKAPGLISTAENELGEHREKWKYVVANLSLAVLMVGFGYLAAICINKCVNDSYTFFSSTRSKAKLEELKSSISNIEGPANAL